MIKCAELTDNFADYGLWQELFNIFKSQIYFLETPLYKYIFSVSHEK